MKTNIVVHGIKSKNIRSKISHIERNHALKKNLFAPDSENINNLPHIIVFKKAAAVKTSFRKIPDTQARSKLSKKAETYKSRIKKLENELSNITDDKKREIKLKTIERNKTKYNELIAKRNNTIKSRTAKQYDFVDIAFSITHCKPELLSEEDYKKLSDIAIEVTLFTFDIDKKNIGSTAHLDQSSAHVHISFEVPAGLTLSEIKKLDTYRDAQLLFNEKIIEAFPHLKIDRICSKAHDNNPYIDLKTFKFNCDLKKEQQKRFKLEEQEDLRHSMYQQAINTQQELEKELKNTKNKLIEAQETIKTQKEHISILEDEKSSYKQTIEDLKIDNNNLKEENSYLKNIVNKLKEVLNTTSSQIINKVKDLFTKQKIVATENHNYRDIINKFISDSDLMPTTEVEKYIKEKVESNQMLNDNQYEQFREVHIDMLENHLIDKYTNNKYNKKEKTQTKITDISL